MIYSDWVRSLLPHVLSKINRVAYGLLAPVDLAGLDPRTPLVIEKYSILIYYFMWPDCFKTFCVNVCVCIESTINGCAIRW